MTLTQQRRKALLAPWARGPAVGAGRFTERLRRLRHAAENSERRAIARALFDTHAGTDGRMQWQEAEGESIWAMSQAALCADLLVTGCYGHSRAREWVLGGASRAVLQAMTLPVSMAH